MHHVLTFCPSALPAATAQLQQYVHVPVGWFGAKDRDVRVSWAQLCETDERGQQLLAVDVACVGERHVELHSLWLTMRCRFANEVLLRCYALSSHHLSPARCAGAAPPPSSVWTRLWSSRPLSAEPVNTVRLLVPFTAVQFDEDGCGLPPDVAFSCRYRPLQQPVADTRAGLPLPIQRLWWRRPNHALNESDADRHVELEAEQSGHGEHRKQYAAVQEAAGELSVANLETQSCNSV